LDPNSFAAEAHAEADGDEAVAGDRAAVKLHIRAAEGAKKKVTN
jgi:hypothetical protein